MKRFLIGIAMCLVCSCAVQAQTNTMRLSVTAADDTLTNADTSYLTATVSGAYDLTFQYQLAKVSGTIAGTAILQGSIDGTNWVAVKNNTTYTANSDSQTLTDAVLNVFQWVVTRHPFKYYRVRVITTGTSVAAPTGIVQYRYNP